VETRESSDQHWRFGIFEVDARRSELRRGGTPVKLREQSFRILVLLLERAGEIVTREELRQGLWPTDTYVDFEHSLNTAIMKLRDALGDSADKPLYIETIPKRGYRFVAPVTVPPATQSAIPSSPGENAIATPARPAGGGREIADLSTALPPDRAKQRHRYFTLGIAMAGVAVIVLCIVAVARRWPSLAPHERGQSSGAVPGRRSVSLVSVPGRLRDPALSPDAKAIAYVWDGDNPERGDVYVQLIGGEKPLRLTHTSSGFICCTSWSPDGRQIAFGLCDDRGGSVMTVAALGGPPRKLTDAPCLYGEGGWPVWMADGKSLIIVGSCKVGGPRGLVLLTLSTGEKRCLTAPPAGMGEWRPSLSPNQKNLAFLRMPASNASVGDIYALSLSGGEVRQVTAERHSIWGMMWAADEQHIIFSSSRGGLAAMWRVKATGGPIESETLYPEVGSLSNDGRRLVYVRDIGSRPSTISQADLSAPGGRVLAVKSLISSANENDTPQLSPDGRQIVYGSCPAGFGGWGGEVWRSNSDGTDSIQLTSFAGHSGTPRWSPNGKFIAFDNRNQSQSQIYVMDADGRNQRKLTSGDYDHVVPSWSRDGRFVYFASNQTGSFEVWKHELATGQEVQVTRHGGFAPLESYDGRTLYYSQFDGAGIWSIPVGGGEEQRLTEAPHLGYWGYFAVTDAGIYLLDTETANGSEKAGGATIQFYDFHSRRLKPVMTLREDPLPWGANLTASRDGKMLLFAEYKVTSSITMVDYQQ
jgi:Tol biopolymer transport system component/DNA-binding winged helix-turn-helix (wHTH) protein